MNFSFLSQPTRQKRRGRHRRGNVFIFYHLLWRGKKDETRERNIFIDFLLPFSRLLCDLPYQPFFCADKSYLTSRWLGTRRKRFTLLTFHWNESNITLIEWIFWLVSCAKRRNGIRTVFRDSFLEKPFIDWLKGRVAASNWLDCFAWCTAPAGCVALGFWFEEKLDSCETEKLSKHTWRVFA